MNVVMEVGNDGRLRCYSYINKPKNTLSSRLAVDFLALPLNTVLCRFQCSTAHAGDITPLNCSLSWVVVIYLFF